MRRARLPILAILVGTLFAFGCDEDDDITGIGGTDDDGSIEATLVVRPDSAALTVGETLTLTARVVDANGDTISGVTLDFTTSLDDVIEIEELGGGQALLTAVDAGEATVVVEDDTRNLTVTVGITVEPAAVGSVTLTPELVRLTLDEEAQLTVVVRDTAGVELPDAAVEFFTADTLVVRVSDTGLVIPFTIGEGDVIARAAGVADTTHVLVEE